MPTNHEIEAAARALAYKARREYASEDDAKMYAEMEWRKWVDSARTALEAAAKVRASAGDTA